MPAGSFVKETMTIKSVFSATFAALAVCSVSTAHAQTTDANARTLAANITQAQLKDYLSFIASDEMEGRDTPSRGLDTTARFLATMLSRFGAKPAGDNGTFFQTIKLTRSRYDDAKTTAQIGSAPLKMTDDFLPTGGGGTATGGLVYVGDGYVVPAKKRNPFAGLDIKGKILVVRGPTRGLPSGLTRQDVPRDKRGTDWFDAETYGAKNGAVGIIELPPVTTAQQWRGYTGGFRRFSGGYRPSTEGTGNRNNPPGPAGQTTPTLPTISLSPTAVGQLFMGEALNGEAMLGEKGASATPFALKPGKTMTFGVARVTDATNTQNVVAVFEGSDPTLKNEYVAIGAHYDHVGIGPPDETGDTIYNGADDDGSGTTALLAMAETLSKSPTKPKRSIVFVWHCGEEKGLWGSDYFTTHPTIPLQQITAQVNIDMIGRSRIDRDRRPDDISTGDEVFLIGAKRMSTQLGKVAEQENHDFLNLKLNYKFDDPNDPEQLFFRSDHFNYARRGVPILFYFDGIHVDYHRPSDEVKNIDFVKYEKVARTVFVTIMGVANLPTRPVVDKPLNP